jgi:hypothetical protein
LSESFPSSFAAEVWASAFRERFAEMPDNQVLVGWFSNALMRGFDENERSHRMRLSSISYDLESIRAYIADHVERHAEADLDVHSLSETERQLLDLLLADRGLLLFLKTYLSRHLILDEVV